MGVDARYFIDGFNEPARTTKVVAEASEALSEDTNHGLWVSLNDQPNQDTKRYLEDDGYCVIESLVRAYGKDSQHLRDEQLEVLKRLFPGRRIYLYDDYHERGEFSPEFEKLLTPEGTTPADNEGATQE